jgi:hypothetical protein
MRGKLPKKKERKKGKKRKTPGQTDIYEQWTTPHVR